MAETKQTTKNAAPKQSDKSTLGQVADKRAELLELRKSNVAGDLANPRAITSARKQLAQLLTALRKEELAAKESK